MASAPLAGGYAVQIGSYALRVSAERQVRELKKQGFDAFVAPVTSGGRELYRVRVGPQPDRAGAAAVLRSLKAVGRDGRVVTNP
ncbi:MAG: SPOR domain-containing protein [Steroidobacteraceae bacterium]|nr:SPOR domain-containing protein [Steroidobacteraceae bacterium]